MIIAHMLVGPGEGENRLQTVLERARSWADQVFCVTDPGCDIRDKRFVDQGADAWWQGVPLFLLDESVYRQTAWNLMRVALDPQPDDWIVCIDADEVISSSPLVRRAAKTFTRKKLGFTVYHMWDEYHYRVDGRFAPRVEYLMFPYLEYAHWPSGSQSRVPDYVAALMPVSEPLSDILHYGYRTEELRMKKLARDEARGRMTASEMMTEPVLEEWNRGGLIRG